METRSLELKDFRSVDADNEKIIEGYFAVFDSPYVISNEAFETVNPHAFDNTLGDDIRALINHDISLVLGRTTTKTLELRVDEHGLFGRIHINPNDTDAMNIYARVARGDVSQCSFGFEILRESTEILEDGTVHFILDEVRCFEVSICTYPAYPASHVEARSAEAVKVKAMRDWKVDMLTKIKEAK